MLESLHISNYALIDRVDIDFFPGLNIITGETGAGKSIMLGALSLILGGRADTRVVRNHDVKSVIEATFRVEGYQMLRQYCLDNDIEWDDQRCILRREIAPNGRSRAFVNDSPVPLNRLQGVAVHLIDIHSQHQNLLLASPEFQLRIVDTIAGNAELLTEHGKRFTAFRNAIHRLRRLKAKIEQSRDDEEFTRFQLEQLEELKLKPGEQQELEARREVLTNLTELKSELLTAIDALVDGHGNAIDALATVSESADAIESILPPDERIAERLESVRIELTDIASTFQDINENLTADPDELNFIEERLNNIYSLQHKHRVDSVEALIELRDTLRRRLDALDDSDHSLAEAEKEARRTRALARETAARLTETRRAAALQFGNSLKELAAPLGMKNIRCDIAVEPADMSATGSDSVSFLFAFNKNQPLMPVGSTASGGEISRLMLCVKSLIASRMQLPSIIFDEIDTGVSGDVANRIGAMMKDVAANIQVIAITHLPQVAAKGSHHFKVYKEDDDTSTHTRISMLSDDQRIAELAVMLSGSAVSPEALANARALLESVN